MSIFDDLKKQALALQSQAQQQVNQTIDYLDTALSPGLSAASASTSAQLLKYSLGLGLLSFGQEGHGIMLEPAKDAADAYNKVAYWLAVSARIALYRKDTKLASYLAAQSRSAMQDAVVATAKSYSLPGSIAGAAGYVYDLDDVYHYDPGMVVMLKSVVFAQVLWAYKLRMGSIAAFVGISGYVAYRYYWA